MLKRYLNKNWASWTRVFKCFYGTKNLILIIRTECCWGKKFTASLSVFIWPVWQGPTLYLLACISIKTNYRSDLFYECSLREGDSSKVRHGHSWVGLMADGLMWLEDVWKHQAVPGWQLTPTSGSDRSLKVCDLLSSSESLKSSTSIWPSVYFPPEKQIFYSSSHKWTAVRKRGVKGEPATVKLA